MAMPDVDAKETAGAAAGGFDAGFNEARAPFIDLFNKVWSHRKKFKSKTYDNATKFLAKYSFVTCALVIIAVTVTYGLLLSILPAPLLVALMKTSPLVERIQENATVKTAADSIQTLSQTGLRFVFIAIKIFVFIVSYPSLLFVAVICNPRAVRILSIIWGLPTLSAVGYWAFCDRWIADHVLAAIDMETTFSRVLMCFVTSITAIGAGYYYLRVMKPRWIRWLLGGISSREFWLALVAAMAASAVLATLIAEDDTNLREKHPSLRNNAIGASHTLISLLSGAAAALTQAVIPHLNRATFAYMRLSTV